MSYGQLILKLDRIMRIGTISQCAYVAIALIFVFTLFTPLGVQKPGRQMGFQEGAFLYESQRLAYKPPMPASTWKTWKSAESSGQGLYIIPEFTLNFRWIEIVLPLWVPLLVIAPFTILGRVRDMVGRAGFPVSAIRRCVF